MTCNGYTNHPTWHFVAIMQNDQTLYNAVVRYGYDLLARVPGMTDQTLGRNVKDRVHSWANGGGWGYPHGHATLRFDTLRHLDLTVANEVDETEVGEAVRVAIALETYDSDQED